jgi:O-antigen/teichoic acid export membrane protein
MIRGIALFAGANAFAQFLNLCAYPLLTYLYSPEDFGVLGVLTSTGLLFGVVVCLRLDTIVQIEEQVADRGLLRLALLLAIGGSILAGLLYLSYMLVFQPPLGGIAPDLIYLISLAAILMLMVFGNGFQPVCRQYAVKQSRYNEVARSQVLRVLTGLLVQISIGMTYPTPFGLLLGFTVGLLISTFLIFPFAQFQGGEHYRLLRRGVATARKNRKTIMIDSLNVFVSNATSAGLILIVSVLYGSSSTGIFLVAMRLISFPIEVIGNAISTVYFQKLSQMVRDKTVTLKPFYQVLVVAVLVVTPFLATLFVFADQLVELVLPSRWGGVSDLAVAFAPLVFAKMIVAAVGYTAISLKRPLMITLWNGFQILALFLVSLICSMNDLTIETFIFTYGMTILGGAISYIFSLRKALVAASVRRVTL